MRMGKKGGKYWETRKRDAKIRDLLRSDSSKSKGEHIVESFRPKRQSEIQTEEGEGATVDELLEGSLSEENTERCDWEKRQEEEEAGTTTRASEKGFRCSMERSMLMLCVLGLLSKVATMEAGPSERGDLFIGGAPPEAGTASLVHPCAIDLSYCPKQSFLEVASRK
jgi:hypothetical protein